VNELTKVTLDCMRQATQDISEIEMIRAKAQMKVALLTALESPGGRIERMARQLLSWGRIVASDEIVRKVDALDQEHVREAGRRLLQGNPTVAAIGPIKGLPSLEAITAGLRG
jgi:predicted Zn-dependent peptidase